MGIEKVVAKEIKKEKKEMERQQQNLVRDEKYQMYFSVVFT